MFLKQKLKELCAKVITWQFVKKVKNHGSILLNAHPCSGICCQLAALDRSRAWVINTKLDVTFDAKQKRSYVTAGLAEPVGTK